MDELARALEAALRRATALDRELARAEAALEARRRRLRAAEAEQRCAA
jgi:hypothetical protein